MKITTIIESAKKCKTNVEKLQKTGVKDTSAYYYAKVMLGSKDTVKSIDIKGPSKSDGDYISRQIPKDKYVNMARRLVEYIELHKEMPNYITYGKIKVEHKLYTYLFAYAVTVAYVTGKLPAEINVSSKLFVAKTESGDKVFNYFIKTFGKVETFTESLRKIQSKGYGFYFDDKLSNIQVIDGLAHKTSNRPNCVDVCQMMWHIAKALGYDVKCLQVWCPVDKITHVRLQVKHSKWTNGKWENYDSAAVAKGNGITSLWCSGSGSYVIATNPAWFLSNVNR